MDKLAIIGKTLTITILIILYIGGWKISAAVSKQEITKNLAIMFSTVWNVVHVVAFIGFLIWSWL